MQLLNPEPAIVLPRHYPNLTLLINDLNLIYLINDLNLT